MGNLSAKPVLVVGGFDSMMSREIRYLQEAAEVGPVHVQLWSDAMVAKFTGQPPKCPEAERLYMLDAMRYVDRVTLCDHASRMPLAGDLADATWVCDQRSDHPDNPAWCRDHGISYRVIPEDALRAIPNTSAPVDTRSSAEKKVIVTGCYDWFHSGHIRFFEEVSQIGQLYVIVGHDANIQLLKGEGHPMFPGTERRFIVGAIRHVHQALISSGDGWLDAEPEIEQIRPDIYAVNEDGDRPEKRDYCVAHGIEYRVLQRTPKEGLPRRESTHLRGF